MLITSPRKKPSISITACNIECTKQIKYLGVFIDNHLKWEPHIKHINNKLTKNIGILNKLRFYTSVRTLKHLYYTLIFPYINYALLSWGSSSQFLIQKIKTKQNKCIRSILFAHTRESATPLYKLLDILKLDKIFNLKISVLVHKIKYAKTNIPNALCDLILSVQDIHKYNTRYALKDNLFRPASRTNYSLSRFKAIASRIWEKILTALRILPRKRFKIEYKSLLLNNL